MNTPEDIDVHVSLIHDPDAAIAALRFFSTAMSTSRVHPKSRKSRTRSN
jgi:hypothetical protein